MLPEHVFVSTASAPNNLPLDDVLRLLAAAEFNNIELGVVHNVPTPLNDYLAEAKKRCGFNFLIHNYFPPPMESFVLNLASNNPQVQAQSMDLAREAISLCHKLEGKFYSVHAGFCFHAVPSQLGKELTGLERFSIQEAEDIFVENIRLLADYALKYSVGILVENNVLTSWNTVNGENKLLLGVDAKDMIRLMKRINHPNVNILIDLGHLKVSSVTLGFSKEDYIHQLAGWIKAFHVHDNDGLNDTHSPISRDSWFWEPICEAGIKEACWILEVQNLEYEKLLHQMEILNICSI